MRKGMWMQTGWVGAVCLAAWMWGVGLPQSSAWAQEVSYRLRLPARISGRNDLKKQLHSRIRSAMLQRGFVIRPRRSIRQGYHLDVAVSVEERFQPDERASCTIQLALQIVILPKKRLVMNATSSGSSRFSKPTSYSRAKRNRLRMLAINKAMHFFSNNMRRAIQKIERKKKTLPKNMILGRKWRRRRRGSWHGSVRGNRRRGGKAQPSRWIPAGVDAARHRPPFPSTSP